MVKHVVNLAVLQNVPAVAVPSLRDSLKRQTGLTGACFCLKTGFDSNTPLQVIDGTIKEVARKYPVPKHHINYKRRQLKIEETSKGSMKIEGGSKKLKFESDEEIGVDTDICLQSPLEDDSSFLSFNTNVSTTIEDEIKGKEVINRDVTSGEDSESDENEPEGGWYVYRKFPKVKAFVPELHNQEDLEKESQGFYSFGNTSDHGEEVETLSKNKRYYEKGVVGENKSSVKRKATGKEYNSLKVKRIKGNKNRIKNTIERLKNRAKGGE